MSNLSKNYSIIKEITWSDSPMANHLVKTSTMHKIITRDKVRLMRSWTFKSWEYQSLKGRVLMAQLYKTIKRETWLKKNVDLSLRLIIRKPRKKWKLTLNNHLKDFQLWGQLPIIKRNESLYLNISNSIKNFNLLNFY